MSKPDMTPISRFPDLEKPGRERLNQLLRLFILTTRGDILTRGATYLKRLALGTAGQILRSDGTDIAWESPGIADNKILEVDGDPGANEHGVFTATGLAGLTDTELLAALTGDAGAAFSWNDKVLTALAGILATAETELTIDTDGEITVTQIRHKVDTFEDAASDDLSTINGGATVNLIILRAEADARTVVIKHGTGNIWLQGKADVSLDDLEDGILLVWDSTNSKWFDIAAGGGGLADIVDDTTPQLGGDLDLNGNAIDFPTTADIADCLDEDDMASDSAVALATQQSIKAYADTKAGVTSAAGTIYADPTNGNDTTGDGSSGSPYASVQKCVDHLVANTPILAHATTIAVGKGTDALAAAITLAGLVIPASLTIVARDTSDNDLYCHGTATSGGNDTLVDISGDTPIDANDEWNAAQIVIVQGTGAGQRRTILDTVAATNTIQVTANWTTNPDATSMYVVVFPKIDGDGSLNYAFQAGGVSNVKIYGLWFDDFLNYTLTFLSCTGWWIEDNIFTCASGRGINCGASLQTNIYRNYIDVGNYGILGAQNGSCQFITYNCIRRNGAAGTGDGMYVASAYVYMTHTSYVNTFIDWAVGLRCLNGGIVIGGTTQVYTNCTADWTPVGASDPAYIS